MNLIAQNLGAIQSAAKVNAPTDLAGLISNVLPYVFYGAGALLLIYLVLGGLQLMVSRGEPKAVAAAQAKITNAVIGLIIILLSGGVVILLGRILKVSIFSNLF